MLTLNWGLFNKLRIFLTDGFLAQKILTLEKMKV